MGTTTQGIWYPDASTVLSPLHTNFATMASSIDARLSTPMNTVEVATIAAAKALPVKTLFYYTPISQYGYVVSTGVLQMLPLNKIVSVTPNTGYSGGALAPGSAEINITSSTIPLSLDVEAILEVNVIIRTYDNAAGYIYLKLNNDPRMDLFWHSRGKAQDISVHGTVRGNFRGLTASDTSITTLVSGNCNAGSGSAVSVLDVVTNLTAIV